MSGLRILVIAPYVPYPPVWGSGMRVYQLVRHLAENHEVTLLCYSTAIQERHAGVLRELCSEVHLVPWDGDAESTRRAGQLRSLFSVHPFHGRELLAPAMQAAIDELLRSATYDVVQLESSRLGLFRFDTGAKLVLDEHNIESELLLRMREGERSRLRRLFSHLEGTKYRALEHSVWARMDARIVPSEREASIVSERARATTDVVPNAVDPDFFQPCSPEDVDPHVILFNGLLTYRPNLDAVHHFLDDVLPIVRRLRPEAVFRIVGYADDAVLEDLRRRGADATGWVDDIRPHVASAACIVVPIRMGSGTRLKVLEALSMAKAVVSTTVGAEGIDVRDGEHLLLADEPADIAHAVCGLLDDAAMRQRLGTAGRELILRDYSWQRAGQLLEGVHRRVVAQEPEVVGQDQRQLLSEA